MPFTEELNKTVLSLKRQFNATGKEIKSINEQGRLAINDTTQINHFFGMCNSLERYFTKFEDIWEQLYQLYEHEGMEKEFPSAKELDIHNAVKAYFYEASTNHYTLTETKKNQSMTSAMNSTVQNNTTESRPPSSLPKIHIPMFTGLSADWPRFKDTFLSLVHNETRLSNIEKFHYLTSSLRDSAYAVISHLPLQAANYDLAWTALTETFDKKRVLAGSYLNKLLSFQPLQGKVSCENLQQFLNQVCESVSAFKLLNIPNEADFILFFLSIKKLSPWLRECFEGENTTTEFPTFEMLKKFCRDKCLTLQLSDHTNDQSNIKKQQNYSKCPPSKSPRQMSLMSQQQAQTKVLSKSATTSTDFPKCLVCQSGAHSILNCHKFFSSTPSERFQQLKEFRGCRNCLAYNHKVANCPSKWHCRFCPNKHHTMLHLPQRSETTSSSNNNVNEKPIVSNFCNVPHDISSKEHDLNLNSTSQYYAKSGILLGTALAEILDGSGQYQTIRLVIDSGSQNSFMTLKCCKKLGLPIKHFPKKISGIGETIFDGTKGQTCCKLRPRNNPHVNLTSHAIVVNNITAFLPNFELTPEVYRPYLNYELADPRFFDSSPIDFLAGADLISDILNGTPFAIANNTPKLFPSIFGIIIMGKLSISSTQHSTNVLFSMLPNDDLNENIKKFWEIEEVKQPDPPQFTDEEIECENHFKNNFSRDASGRYIVRLPFKSPRCQLPDNSTMAIRRFLSLESKLNKNENLRKQYCTFMKEYELLNHMSITTNLSKFTIPHHSIFKEDRNETKLRVVFDGSAKINNVSLNSQLMVGAKWQKDICQILLNFRLHKIAVVTDVVKMYRNILIDPRDRPYQHILWRPELSSGIKTYELNTVTYGLTSSPFLALRTMKQLCEDEGPKFPQATKVILRDMYVDDIVTGSDNVSDALQLQQELIELMACGQFSLSKWASNCPELLDAVRDKVNSDVISMSSSEDTTLKILGLQWSTSNDCFTYNITPPKPASTKRGILSIVAQLYDPIGFVSPTILIMKAFIQEIWKEGLDWDEPIPVLLQQQWDKIVCDLDSLSKLKIPRFIFVISPHFYKFIGFSDASTVGYCATIYLQTCTNNQIQTNLLISKTKLAPVKTISIPRLELCGALLLTKLYKSILPFRNQLPDCVTTPYFFCDSQIVLCWLKTPAFKLKTFVANRVTEIVDIIPNKYWHHVPSQSNPSDVGSRGQLPHLLITNNLWWYGPDWLQFDESLWPKFNCQLSEPPELKPVKSILFSSNQASVCIEWMEKFSSYNKLIRSRSFMNRFIYNCRNPKTKIGGPLKLNEIHETQLHCVKDVQNYYFTDTQSVQRQFSNLNLFVDNLGVLRVGGRLKNANLTENHKHPIFLPYNAHFTKLIIEHYHLIYLHPGPSLLQALVRTKYWVPSLRRLIRQCEFKCLSCYKSKAQAFSPQMGDLPSCRVTLKRAFLHVGIDFAGPFVLRENLRRKAALSKVYCCIFVCMAIKALHIEAVTRLTTESFLSTLDRFISRRGLPSDIYTDCGTNFIGAAKTLKELYQWYSQLQQSPSLSDYNNNKGIHWHFNPPYSPHFGGLWERAVRSVKRVFTLVSSNTAMTYEEFATLLSRIESILNSRPLCPLTDDADDLNFLSPGHFLVGCPLVTYPTPSLLDTKENTLSRWQMVKKQADEFGKKWHVEYLSTLQKRPKWSHHAPNLKKGDLVLIKDPSSNYMSWPTARIIDVHAGSDGVIRVVTLKTASSIYKRTVANLIPLLPLNTTISET